MNDHDRNPKDQYLVRHEDKVHGPFDAKFIETMILAGVYPSSVSLTKIEEPSRAAFSEDQKHKTRAIPEKAAKGTEETPLMDDQRSLKDTSAPRMLMPEMPPSESSDIQMVMTATPTSALILGGSDQEESGRKIFGCLICLCGLIIAALLFIKGWPDFYGIEWKKSQRTSTPVVGPSASGEIASEPAPEAIANVVSPAILGAGELRKVIEVKLSPEEGMQFCYCQPSKFSMGSPKTEKLRDDDENQVDVTIGQGFWMAKSECTQAQWAAIVEGNPSHFKGPHLPVESVSWEDVQGFIGKFNDRKSLGIGWRMALPTEAQWEYACRADTTSVFNLGDFLTGKMANIDGNHPYGTNTIRANLAKTCLVGQYGSNSFGIFDMHGNVREWCGDRYSKMLSGGQDPAGETSGNSRVVRGGSWLDAAAVCRSANRLETDPGLRRYDLGFRPVIIRSK